MAETKIIVLTPTTRLARSLAREYALDQTAAGATAWRSRPVLAFSAWLNQLREDFFLDADDARTPISSDQAFEVWRSVIDTDIFIGEPRIADLAERAWRLLHEYQLTTPAQWPELLMTTDHLRFQGWVRDYQNLCRKQGWVDLYTWLDELPDLIESRQIQLPQTIELAGFVLPPTPQQQRILDACEQAEATIVQTDQPPEAPSAPVQSYAASSEKSELLAAACWARDLVEQNPQNRIAIIVPDLQGRVEQAENALRRVFDPHGFALQTDAVEAWHISLGKPLPRWPLTADALALLQLNPNRLTQVEIQRWLRSPFLHGWPEESLARAESITRLARIAPYEVTLFEFNRDGTTNSPRLQHTLDSWRKTRATAPERARPSAWTEQFQNELTALGFGRGRRLNSQEHQLLARWQSLLEQFSALDTVIEQPMRRSAALKRLNERAARTIFRERNAGVPVEVLGIKEALGSRFDAIWMTSMDQDAWPLPARREPLIPGKIQRAVAKSTSNGKLEQAQLELNAVLAAAPLKVFSCGIDPELPAQNRLTPMLADRLQQPLGLELSLEPQPAKMEVLPDDSQAPRIEAGSYSGGTGLFQKQSDCPFRAFAEIRLRARSTPTSRPGLDAGTRGSLVHKMLEAFWHDWPDALDLHSMDQEQLLQRMQQAAEQALRAQFSRYRLAIGSAGRTLEKQRLVALLQQWLEVEKQRPNFRVQALEQALEIRFGGIQTRGMIDRVDQIESGTAIESPRLLIDYKTGTSAGSGQWLPEQRMRDVQLPAYALSLKPAPSGIAFAKLLPAKAGFDGIQNDATHATPAAAGIRIIGQFTRKHALSEHESWLELLNQWRDQLEALGEQFLAGHAEVNPRDGQTCRYCHLHALCRIHERVAFSPDQTNE